MAAIAGAAGVDQTTLDAMGGGGRAPVNGAAPDQVRAKIEAAVGQIRDLSGQLDQISQSIPGSDKLVAQMKKQLRQLAQMAAQAGATQNGSADALPS